MLVTTFVMVTSTTVPPPFTRPFEPISVAGAFAAVAKTLVAVERVERTVSSIDDTHPYGVTLQSAAPTGRGVVLYQFVG